MNTPEVGTCGCGCGSPTPRRFRPGHDAKLKGALVEQTRDSRWWVREAAVKQMVRSGWGRHVDRVILATTPIRSRWAGRFCETRHIDSLHGSVLDDSGRSHSVWFCPAASSRGRWVKGAPQGWICEACIHLQDWSEMVADPAYDVRQDSVSVPTFVPPTRIAKRPKRSKVPPSVDPVWAELMAEAWDDLDRRAA